MQKNKLLVVALGALFALPALAEVPASEHAITGNVSLVSNNVWRGFTQTEDKPAIQGGFDYGHASGAYAGIWGSNVSYPGVSGKIELDTYFGFKGSFATDLSYDVGFIRYMYPGNSVANTNELYGSIGWKLLTAKYSRSLTDFFGVPDTSGASYIELNGSYTLEEPGVTLGAHYGQQTVSGADSVSDYSLKASKDFSGYALGVLISKTNLSDDTAKYVLSVSRSF